MVKIKRVYEKPSEDDGRRFLVDRLWPRGLTKEELGAVLWLKDLAPSNELRRQFHHEPERWEEFRKRYLEELEGRKELVRRIIEEAGSGNVTLLYAAKDTSHNNAVVLKEFISYL